MTTIALRAQIFGQPNASRLVDCFRVHVCSLQNAKAVVGVGDAFTTAEEATAAADALFAARVKELGTAAPEGAFISDATTRSYTVAPGTGGEWGERVEVRVRRAGSSDWTAI